MKPESAVEMTGSGRRKNVAAHMSDEEMTAVAEYLSTL